MWMKTASVIALTLVTLNAKALPILTESEDGSGLIATIYPDHEDANKVYFFPNTGGLEKNSKGEPRFGMSYWSPAAPTEIAGYFSAIFRLNKSHDLSTAVENHLKAGKKVAVLPVQQSAVYFMQDREGNRVNTALFDEVTSAPHGGRAEDSIGISGTLTKPGAMALKAMLSSGGLAAEVQYCYQVTGVSPIFNAKIKLNYNKVYKHFVAKASGGKWWWKWNVRLEVENLVEKGDIKIEINGGNANQYDYIMAMADRLMLKFFEPVLPNRRNEPSGKFGVSRTEIYEDREFTYSLTQREIINRDYCVALGLDEVKAFPWLITNADQN